MTKRMTAIAVAIALTGTGAGAVATAQGQSEAIDERVTELMVLADVPGMSLAKVEGGRVVWTKAYGVRRQGSDEAVDSETVFEAASLSKPIFAYVALQLVDEGVLQLDRPLAEYLAFDDVGDDARAHLVTARMVLNHTSGLPNWRGDGDLTFMQDPGEKFNYSGEGFMYLQQVVEHLTGESLDRLAQERVFGPLDMKHSSFVWPSGEATNVAHPHNRFAAMDKRKVAPPAAAYSLHTTSGDYATFLAAAMSGAGLSDSLHAAVLAPQIEVDKGVAWGLGWGLQWTGEAHLGIWHWGHNRGYRAYVLGFPERDDGFVMFTNSDNGMLLLADLVDELYGGEQPAIAWLDYTEHDAPSRLARLDIEEVIRTQGIDAGVERLRELRKTAPPEAFEESMLNTLGYDLLRGGQVDDAIVVFQLNTALYPAAFNTYDSLGEAYYRKGDYGRALKNYRRSVRLNPDNRNGFRMIAEIEQEVRAQGG